MGVTLAEVEQARHVLGDVAAVTPVESSRWLGGVLGAPVHLKCEHLQRTGSFKIRGAYVRVAGLSAEERARGVVAASAGNHAQGVALAAALLGASATVFMPRGATIPKEQATRAYGATVRYEGTNVDEALVAALAFADETGAVVIHPFDHPDIIAGQGTVGLELVEQVPDLASVVVPCGGGGLLAGVATAVKGLRPDVRVIGVQAEGAACYPPSLAAGQPQTLASMRTMADGIAIGRPGEVPFAAVSELVDEMVTVGEESLSRALLLLAERAKQVVEPGGAAAVAAMLDHPHGVDLFPGPAVAVLSGGNIDPLLLLQVLRHGLAAAGRYLSVTVRVPDRPGELLQLLQLLADADANVLDVVHQRVSARLNVDEVEIALRVETRGQSHREAVIDSLRRSGYSVILA
ncbi:MAG: threonine ammonia-lyase [Nocardioidaceae bacterium]|nr:threonine ammonia-lyase [Pseudonocardiales bacterium]MBA3719099.1 threonine ammonia-lyase [Nocardioidaceae bacterium]